ncbi:MAG TPA: ATP-binding protein [Kofleriaceae bacterium]|nr:ATP-binding protein [Kofleriaceae bacterium]
MDELSPIGAIRRRPGMYAGDTDDGSGVINLVLEVVANAYDQYLAGRCSSVVLTFAADGTITIEDDGPGFAAAGANGLPPLDKLLTELSFRPTVDGHRPHVHLGLGGLGLCVVNALSEEFELVSARDGTEVRAAYARGEVVTPTATTKTQRANGTRIRFRPDPVIFAHVRVPRVELTRILEDLTFLSPTLRVRWSFDGDDNAARRLVARVALDVPCAFAEVAHMCATYETANGPMQVEVALAWRTSPFSAITEPVIHSFVNLRRTPEHGQHVAGMLHGVRAFLADARIPPHTNGLVAAVSVVLADVIYGNPSKDRLDSPEARGPVSDATQRALAAWAIAHPLAIAHLRGTSTRTPGATQDDGSQ